MFRWCTAGADVAERTAFIAKLGAIIRKRHEPDVEAVVEYLKRRKKDPIKDPKAARTKALEKQYKESIMTEGRPGEILVKEIMEAALETAKISDDHRAKSEPHVFKSENVMWGQRGTQACIDELCEHARKGVSLDV